MYGMTEQTGGATYSASQTGDTVTLTATGILPCSNWEARLIQRPERIFPPFYELVIFTTEICLTATQPFSESVMFRSEQPVRELTVFEGEKRVTVTVTQTGTPGGYEPPAEERFVVIQNLNPPHNCQIIPEGTIFIAIFSTVFGPDTREACEAWAAENCPNC